MSGDIFACPVIDHIMTDAGRAESLISDVLIEDAGRLLSWNEER